MLSDEDVQRHGLTFRYLRPALLCPERLFSPRFAEEPRDPSPFRNTLTLEHDHH